MDFAIDWDDDLDELEGLGFGKLSKEDLAELEKIMGTKIVLSEKTQWKTAQKAITFLNKRLEIPEYKQKKLMKYLTTKTKGIAELSYSDNLVRINNYVGGAIEKGQSLNSFINTVKLDDIYKDTNLSEGYWQNVLRTNEGSAYNGGRFEEQVNDDNVEYFAFYAVLDDRTTDICEEISGTILPKKDAFWDTYYPPNNWQCRSEVISVNKSQKGKPTKKPRVTKNANLQNKDFNQNPAKTWNKETPRMIERKKKNDKIMK